MKANETAKKLSLSSGTQCLLISRHRPFCPHYRLLCLEDSRYEPTFEEKTELLQLAVKNVRQIAREHYGSEEKHMLISNGAEARRSPGCHYHLIPVANDLSKALIYFGLFLRNLIDALDPHQFRAER